LLKSGGKSPVKRNLVGKGKKLSARWRKRKAGVEGGKKNRSDVI